MDEIKKEIENLKRKIAALETERLLIKRYVKESIKSDEELIKIVENLRRDLCELKTINTNLEKQRRFNEE